MSRGIVFEINYAPAIRDDTIRKYFISNGQNLAFWCKGRVREIVSQVLLLTALAINYHIIC